MSVATALRRCGGLAFLTLAGAASAATHTVSIDGSAYAPAEIQVARGDTVVWVNRDPFPHTVTMEGAFDSGSIAPGRRWQYRASKSGEFRYSCTFHPNMQGTLRVR